MTRSRLTASGGRHGERGWSSRLMWCKRFNDVGRENGELELSVKGQSRINVSGLVLRSSEAGPIHGMQLQTFFGGAFLLPTYRAKLNTPFSMGRSHSRMGVSHLHGAGWELPTGVHASILLTRFVSNLCS
jgi:hypothetical protein